MLAVGCRREKRFPADIPAKLLDSTSQTLREPLVAHVIDISRHGLKLSVWHDAPLRACFSLSLSYDYDDSLCLAEVIWKRETNKAMIYGLQIIHWTYMTPRLLAHLQSLEAKSDLEVDVEDVSVLRDIVLPLHSDSSTRS